MIKKFETFLSCGVAHVAILFDDIPNKFKLIIKNEAEGEIHAKIINETIEELSRPIFAVPRIYSDELNVENKNYLKIFLKQLHKNVQVFFTGKYIVSKLSVVIKKLYCKKLKKIKLLIGIIIMQMIIVQKNYLLDLGKIKI